MTKIATGKHARIDAATRKAIEHAIHCPIGCSIDEVVGMLIASAPD